MVDILLTLFKLTVVFIILIVLPFLILVLKVFPTHELSVKISISTAIGLFVAILLAYILSFLNIFTAINFIILYICVIITANIYPIKHFIEDKRVKHYTLPNLQRKLSNNGFFTTTSSSTSVLLPPPLLLPSSPPLLLLLLLAIGIGAYYRLVDPLSTLALNASDPYYHLCWCKALIAGDSPLLTSTLGYISQYAKSAIFYPKGFHFILILFHYYSSVDLYTVFRFAGALISSFSILTVYAFVTTATENKYIGIFTALGYAGFPLFHRWIVWQTLAMPEILGLALLPLLLLFVFETLKDLVDKNLLQFKNLSMFFATLSLIILTHHITFAMTIYLLLIFTFITVIFYRRRLLNKSNRKFLFLYLSPLFIGIIMLFSYYYVIAIITGKDYSSWLPTPENWLQFLLGLFTTSTPIVFTVNRILGIAIATIIIIYGLYTRKFYCLFIGSAALLFAYIHITNNLLLAGLPYRAGSYFAMSLSWNLGIFLAVIIYQPTSWLRNLYPSLKTLLQKLKLNFGFTLLCGHSYCYYYSRIYKITVFAIFISILIAIPPNTAEYYKYGYEETVKVALKLSTMKFDNEAEVRVYAEAVTPAVNRVRCILAPTIEVYELHQLVINNDPTKWIPETNYTYVIIEKNPYPFIEDFREVSRYDYKRRVQVQQTALNWITTYHTTYNQDVIVTVYYENTNIIVYLITKI